MGSFIVMHRHRLKKVYQGEFYRYKRDDDYKDKLRGIMLKAIDTKDIDEPL
jgi:hypothetical protein